MNAFTKVLVVLVFALSLIFAAAQIVLYGKRENLGQMLAQKQEALQKAQDENATLNKNLSDTQSKLERTISDLRLQNQQIQTDLDNKTQAAADLSGQLTTAQASVSSLTQVTQTQLASIDALNTQIKQLQDQNSDRQAQIEAKVAEVQKLNDTIKDKNANIGDLDQQLTEVKKDNKKLADANEEMTAKIRDMLLRGIEVEPAYAPPISGKVLAVDTELQTAVINQGSTAGVKPNTEFTIYRDSQFVARMVITDVDMQVAVGHVILLAKGEMPKEGDDATTTIR